jgi:hypothetical protein
MATTVAPIVASRDAVATLEKKISQSSANSIQVNLENVDFISRSAAHELLQVKESLASHTPKKTIEFTNANDTVATMIRVVASNRAMPLKRPILTNINTVSVTDLEKPSIWRLFSKVFVRQ